MLRSMAAANATKAAASSVHVTCCTPTSTSGLLHLPTPATVDDITNPPLYKLWVGVAAKPKSDPDPDPGLDRESDLDSKSQLLCGLNDGVDMLVVISTVNFPPSLVLMVELETVVVVPEAAISSWERSNRYPRASVKPGSLQASRRPQGFQVPHSGRRISQAPGLDRLTLSKPGDGTNGVTIDAIATGEPERSWTVIDHPFRSLEDWTLSVFSGEGSQFLEQFDSDKDDLQNNIANSNRLTILETIRQHQYIN